MAFMEKGLGNAQLQTTDKRNASFQTFGIRQSDLPKQNKNPKRSLCSIFDVPSDEINGRLE